MESDLDHSSTTPPSGLQIARVALEDLHLDPANARAHGDRNLAAIVSSLERFGQVEPLVVNRGTGRVVGGNGRLVAMRKLGWTQCDVVEIDIDGVEAAALGIALNRTAELAEWDDPALGALLAELRAEDALLGVGFDDAEVDAVLAELEAEAGGEANDPGPDELPKTPITQTGDLWILGDHRLLCGDSTSPADLARLMGGEKAALLATDPPYFVDYQQEGWDDFEGDEEAVAFYAGFLCACVRHCRSDVAVYQWHAHRRQALVQRAWEAAGLLMHQQIIWSKSHGTFGRSHYQWAHEPALYGWPKGSMPDKARRPKPGEITVWQIDQAGEQAEAHPTQKPREVFSRPILSHTLSGEVVLEPFCGSGTQIIAAEQTRRACFAMEKSPGYVDVAVRRWEKATGREAVLHGTNQTFAQVAKEREDDTEDPR